MSPDELAGVLAALDRPGDLGLEVGPPLGGGSIASVRTATMRGGGEVIVKETPYPAELEAEGLVALGAAGAPVPRVIALDADVLVLERVGGPSDWAELGACLARCHLDSEAAGAGHGWHRDNRIGSLVQPNTPCTSWGDFVAERRILPLLDAEGFSPQDRARLEVACAGPLVEVLDDHAPRPCLLHGDLWSGNVVAGRWLIDPAVHRGDREVDLAMMDLFGGFAPACWEAYLATCPLPGGWQRRRAAYQLWFLGVHVALFGASWTDGLRTRLDTLGW